MSGLVKEDYANVLEEATSKLGIPTNVPAVICGMAGAAQGWHEATYMSASEELLALGRLAVHVPDQPREVYILPGVMQSNPSML